MLRPLDCDRRDGPLYPGSSRTLRDCIDPRHQLVQIDAAFDFRALAADLLRFYDPKIGRPPIHPEDLAPRDPADEPPTPAGGEEDVFVARDTVPGTDTTPPAIVPRRYQDAKGRLPLPQHDRDCRWRTIRGTAILGYKEHVLTERSGFILARRSTPANVSDVAGAIPLLDRSPVPPKRLTADTGYQAGRFRHLLQQRGITSYIPVARTQDATPEQFTDHFDHFVCSQGARLRPTGVPDADQSVRYAARAADCRPCPLRTTCITGTRSAKVLWASRYRYTYPQAHRRNGTVQYTREQRRRKTIAEGVFARLDRLGGTTARYRGVERVESHGSVTAMAHNILKAMTKRRFLHRDGAAGPRMAGQRTDTVRVRGFHRRHRVSVHRLLPTLTRPQARHTYPFSTRRCTRPLPHISAALGVAGRVQDAPTDVRSIMSATTKRPYLNRIAASSSRRFRTVGLQSPRLPSTVSPYGRSAS